METPKVDAKPETSRPSSSYVKFDYDTVCAGTLFLIKNPAHIERVHKYLDPDYFFVGDDSMQVKALRRIVKTILEIRNFCGVAALSIAFFDTKLAQLVDSDENTASRQLFQSWLNNPKIIEKSTDRGCQMVYLDFLRVIQIVKWSQEFMPKFKSGQIADAVKSMKDLTGTLDSIRFNDIAEAVDVSKMSMDEIKGLLSLSQSAKGEIFLLGQPELDEDIGGFERRALHVFISATNGGKCFGKDTPILMFDGTTKLVQDVKENDLLMGPDSKPRTVLSTTTGSAPLFKITPNKGDSWVCNGPHMLHLVDTIDGTKHNITVDDYLKNTTKEFKHRKKLYITGVDFPSKITPLDPYFVGLWIGDGTRREAIITTADKEIEDYIKKYAENSGLDVTLRDKKGNCSSWSVVGKKGITREYLITKCWIDNEKRIPDDYLKNNKEVRMKLLAGLIDTDGTKHHEGYSITTKYEGLKNDIIFLARSLGFRVHSNLERKTIKKLDFEGDYWRISIYGSRLCDIPVLLERKKIVDRKKMRHSERTGFSVNEIGMGNFFGFEVSGDHLFLLGDFTVAHNSMMTHHIVSRCITQKLYAHITVVEDRPRSYFRRLFANLTGIEINKMKFRYNTLTEDEKKLIKAAQDEITKYVKIDFGYGEDLTTIHQKKIEYDAERVSKSLPPYDVDIVDYTGHIADKSVGEKSYEKFRNAFAERKNYCLINNKIGFDFAQVNRAGFQKKQNNLTLTHGELAGSYDLSQVCDNIISINRFPDDVDKNTATLLITKVKDGKLYNKGYKVGTDFARARWNMDLKEMDLTNTIAITEVSQTL